MNNEIKEILDKLQYIANNQIIEYDTSLNPDNVDENIYPLTSNECVQLLDHITNLEKEIKELRETTDRLTNKEYKKDDTHLGIARTKEQLERMQYLLCFKSKVEITDILIDTEEKIDKAIEFIKNTKVVSYEQDEVYLFKDIPEGYDLLNILQGEKNE